MLADVKVAVAFTYCPSVVMPVGKSSLSMFDHFSAGESVYDGHLLVEAGEVARVGLVVVVEAICNAPGEGRVESASHSSESTNNNGAYQ